MIAIFTILTFATFILAAAVHLLADDICLKCGGSKTFTKPGGCSHDY